MVQQIIEYTFCIDFDCIKIEKCVSVREDNCMGFKSFRPCVFFFFSSLIVEKRLEQNEICIVMCIWISSENQAEKESIGSNRFAIEW